MNTAETAIQICESDSLDDRFQEIDPSKMTSRTISKKTFLTLLHQGLEQNLIFLTSKFPTILNKSKTTHPQEAIEKVLALIQSKIGDVKRNPQAHDIFSQMLINALQEKSDPVNKSDIESDDE